MNSCAIDSLNYLLEIASALRGGRSHKEVKEANSYLSLFIPKAFLGKRKRDIIKNIICNLKSKEIFELDSNISYIIVNALENFYEGNDTYELEKEIYKEMNIWRIDNEDDRNYVINFFRNNLKSFSNLYCLDDDTEESLTFLMSLVEDVRTYKDYCIVELMGNDEFLDLEPIEK
jgi:hypothetical protein